MFRRRLPMVSSPLPVAVRRNLILFVRIFFAPIREESGLHCRWKLFIYTFRWVNGEAKPYLNEGLKAGRVKNPPKFILPKMLLVFNTPGIRGWKGGEVHRKWRMQITGQGGWFLSQKKRKETLGDGIASCQVRQRPVLPTWKKGQRLRVGDNPGGVEDSSFQIGLCLEA